MVLLVFYFTLFLIIPPYLVGWLISKYYRIGWEARTSSIHRVILWFVGFIVLIIEIILTLMFYHIFELITYLIF